MDESNRSLRSTDDKQLLLKEYKVRQRLFKEGSGEWMHFQRKIDQIVAERYLEYVNR